MSLFGDIERAPLSPLLETLEEARAAVDPSLTADEYTLARIMGSEFFHGSAAEILCIGDADLSRAADRKSSVFDHATRGNGFGPQGEGSPPRPVSTARPPAPRHVVASLALMRPRRLFGLVPLPSARGIAQGARRYFDPRDQDAAHAKNGARSCSATAILRRWTFDLPIIAREADCILGETRGPDQEEWVGSIQGVDPFRLMLMRRRSSALIQQKNFDDALRVIETRGEFRPLPVARLGLLAMLSLGAIVAARGLG